jgi:hypothetical protein
VTGRLSGTLGPQALIVAGLMAQTAAFPTAPGTWVAAPHLPLVAGGAARHIPFWRGYAAGPSRAGQEGSLVERRSVSSETLAAQALGEADPVSGGLAPIINLSTSYEKQPDGSYHQDRVYTRADNPTSEHAERLLAALEGSGCACALFGSGMAAATVIFQSLLPGDHVLVSRVLYWGVRK